ncbi:hypothetical protein FOS14_17040 [Skermania sp. ID1734]|uniref:Rv2732c family membrane protein n=1 Tax=Skermania sp. ID1734 TaxID=2597516 RepID=UPI00117F9A7A|nr:hypothetical protein [Skermania sp. ID1734]TSD96066.1 hypothetical protein FOS14_17040 [Skermania sp. ID1734]
MSDPSGNAEHDGDHAADAAEEFRADLDAVEKKVAGEIDPGFRAVVVAILVFVILVSFTLPHTGSARGFDVLAGDKTALGESIALPSRLFVWFSAIFGVGFSVLALLTKRWVLAWTAVAGCAITCVFGMFAIWSRQTLAANLPGGGVGIGLIIGWIGVLLLTFHWLRVVWSRTALQLAAEQERRVETAKREQRDSDWRKPLD